MSIIMKQGRVRVLAQIMSKSTHSLLLLLLSFFVIGKTNYGVSINIRCLIMCLWVLFREGQLVGTTERSLL